jgi:hypothetical protein
MMRGSMMGAVMMTVVVVYRLVMPGGSCHCEASHGYQK